MKADTKWVEYTATGAVVAASGGTVYDDCCSGGCGILANGTAEWLEGLERLIGSDRERIGIVQRAQAKLEGEYNVTRLREQVLEMLEMVRSNAQGRAKPKQKRLVVAG
jgi:urocanate hydratase